MTIRQPDEAFMHKSFVTTVPTPRGRAGDSHGNEQGFDQSFAMAMRGKYPGFALYKPKGPQGARWRSGRASDSESRGPGFDPHKRHRVVSLSKTHLLPPYSTGKPRKRLVRPDRLKNC